MLYSQGQLSQRYTHHRPKNTTQSEGAIPLNYFPTFCSRFQCMNLTFPAFTSTHFFLLAKTFCVIILLDGGQPVLTLPLTSSGLQVKDFVMLQQAAELEELQLQPECSGVALASRHKITISMCCVCNKLHFFFSL